MTATYMVREPAPLRRHVWRQKLTIVDIDGSHRFYVEFGDYEDGRLAEVFITAHKAGSFVRGTLDTLARSISLALQSGTSPLQMAHMLRGQDYPPRGKVVAEGSSVTECLSLADYIAQEIELTYGAEGRRR